MRGTAATLVGPNDRLLFAVVVRPGARLGGTCVGANEITLEVTRVVDAAAETGGEAEALALEG